MCVHLEPSACLSLLICFDNFSNYTATNDMFNSQLNLDRGVVKTLNSLLFHRQIGSNVMKTDVLINDGDDKEFVCKSRWRIYKTVPGIRIYLGQLLLHPFPP